MTVIQGELVCTTKDGFEGYELDTLTKTDNLDIKQTTEPRVLVDLAHTTRAYNTEYGEPHSKLVAVAGNGGTISIIDTADISAHEIQRVTTDLRDVTGMMSMSEDERLVVAHTYSVTIMAMRMPGWSLDELIHTRTRESPISSFVRQRGVSHSNANILHIEDPRRHPIHSIFKASSTMLGVVSMADDGVVAITEYDIFTGIGSARDYYCPMDPGSDKRAYFARLPVCV